MGKAVSEPQGLLTIVSKLVQHRDWIKGVLDMQSDMGHTSQGFNKYKMYLNQEIKMADI